MYQAILFDFDGVLTMDATGTISIMNYIENHTAIDRQRFEHFYRKHNKALLYGGKTHESIWTELCKDMAESIDIGVLEAAFKATPIDQNMICLVEALKTAGYVIGMITDNKCDRIETILTHFQLKHLFDAVVISADIGSGKNQNEIFNEMVKKISLDYDACVFIDNNRENLIRPNALGMASIYYDHGIRDFEGLVKALRSLGIQFELEL